MKYRFEGVVYHYQKIVDNHYVAETEAPSAAKALNNLAHRWRQENNFVSYLKVRLVGEITEIPEDKPAIPPRIEDLQEVMDFG